MHFGKSVGVACSTFAVTNIDDMFVLVTFFAEASTSKTLTPLKITLGQYIGFTAIIIISMIGFGASLFLPPQPIGFLGLLPILLGIWKLLELPPAEDAEELEISGLASMQSILKVSMVTVMNGGDNIGIYIPLFSQAKGAEMAVYLVTYYLLLGIWCLLAFLVMRQKHVLLVAQKYIVWILPLLYMGLGIYILMKSSCYPWSIQHINKKISKHSGKTIMAVVTTVVLLGCIGIMLWSKLRKTPAERKSAASVEETGNSSATPGATNDDSVPSPSLDGYTNSKIAFSHANTIIPSAPVLG